MENKDVPPSAAPTVSNIQKVPKDDKEKEKDKENEKARVHNKKMQEKDLPHFKSRGESIVDTQKHTYEIRSELGHGSFGAVFAVTRLSDRKNFAMKCESVNMKKTILPHEASVLLALGILKSPHFLDMVDHGIVVNRFLFVILKLVGPNLWDVRVRLPERRWTLSTSLKLAEQTLAGLRDLHRVGFLHRDIKPPNFAIGREEDDTFHTVYVLDFGLCRKIAYKGVDIRMPRKECPFRGTTRYAPMAAHDGKEQSRKDDIESWWYMAAEFLVDLPWKQFRGNDRENVRKFKNRLRTDLEYFKFMFRKICFEQMHAILQYLDSLEYASIPDYDFVFHHIQNAAVVNNVPTNGPVDWDPKKDYNGPRYKTGENYIVKALLE